jgi:hypothetical protein
MEMRHISFSEGAISFQKIPILSLGLSVCQAKSSGKGIDEIGPPLNYHLTADH